MEQRGGPGPPGQASEVPQEPTRPCVRRWGTGCLEEGPRSALGVLASFSPGDCSRPTSLPLGMLSLRLPATPVSFY